MNHFPNSNCIDMVDKVDIGPVSLPVSRDPDHIEYPEIPLCSMIP